MHKSRWKLTLNRIIGLVAILACLSLLTWWVFEQPGVPKSAPEDEKAFSIAFWSALYASVLASLPTGLVVGLVVWQAQERSEKHQMRRQFEREVALLQERLRPVVNQENPIVIDSAINSEPRPAKAVVGLLADQPIELWRNNLPAPHLFLDSIRELQKVHMNFTSMAGKLDYSLRQFIRARHAAENIIEVNDSSRHFYCIGRIQGVPSEMITPWIDMPGSALPKLEEIFRASMSQADISERAKQYLEARGRVLEKVEILAKTLVSA